MNADIHFGTFKKTSGMQMDVATVHEEKIASTHCNFIVPTPFQHLRCSGERSDTFFMEVLRNPDPVVLS